MFFFLATLIISVACAAITIKTLVGYSDMKSFYKAAISSFVALGWFSPLVVRFIEAYNIISDDEAHAFIVQILYLLMGFSFILFALIALRDIIWYLLYSVARTTRRGVWHLDPKNLVALSYANQIVVGLSVIISIYAFYEGNKIPAVQNIYYTSEKIKQNITIAQVTDMHITRATRKSRIREIVDAVNRTNPDVIVLTGDIIDDNISKIDGKLDVLKELSAPYGIYSVMGSTEFHHDIYASKRAIEALGIKFLFNGGTHVNNTNVFLGGIPDLGTMFERINFWRTVGKSKKTDYKVLLSHSPNIIDSLSEGLVDLVLSGHTHGGQVFPFHFLVMQYYKYLSGEYRINGTNLYVSKGVGSLGPQMRLFAPLEITLIHLQKK